MLIDSALPNRDKIKPRSQTQKGLVHAIGKALEQKAHDKLFGEMYEFIRATSKEPCEDVVSVRADEYCHNCVSCDARALIAKIEEAEKDA